MGYLIFALWIYVGVYTVSYGIFEWKRKNTSGAISLWILVAIGGILALGKAVSGLL